MLSDWANYLSFQSNHLPSNKNKQKNKMFPTMNEISICAIDLTSQKTGTFIRRVSVCT